MKLKIVILADGCGWNSERRTIVGSLVGKKISLGNVMICRETNTIYRQDLFRFYGVRICKVSEI